MVDVVVMKVVSVLSLMLNRRSVAICTTNAVRAIIVVVNRWAVAWMGSSSEAEPSLQTQ